MTCVFTKKELTPPERVCFRLRALRQEKKVSLEEMEKRTLISKVYLQAIEECRFQDIPHPVIYKKNFVKSYAEALGAEPENFLKQYVIEEAVKEKHKKFVEHVDKDRWYFLSTALRYGLVVIAAIILVAYLGWQVRRIIKPPRLLVYSPTEGMITDYGSVVVQGETEKEAMVLVNGREIKNGEDGQFKEEINLSAGVNTLEIVVKKKHGKTTTEVRHVVYKTKD